METLTLARNAMATRFELVLHGENPVALRAAGEEALDEIDRIENQLSLYRPASEIARINARAAREPVRVTPALLSLLQQARKLHAESGGAFDITIAPLVHCWGFMCGTGRMPAPGEIAEARANLGMNLVQLDTRQLTVRFTREGVMLDLGAIGKGYAVGRAAEILHAAGISSALIHGGTSTVYAIGSPPGAESWKVAVETPKPVRDCARESVANNAQELSNESGRCLTTAATVPLHDEAMSVSAIRGRFFQSDGKVFGHVIDPRSGQPVDHTLLAAVVLPSATETDALSTALLVLGAAGLDQVSGLRANMRALVFSEVAGKARITMKNLAYPPES